MSEVGQQRRRTSPPRFGFWDNGEYQLVSNPPYDADRNNLEEHYADRYFTILETENTIVDSVAFSPRAIAQWSIYLRTVILLGYWNFDR